MKSKWKIKNLQLQTNKKYLTCNFILSKKCLNKVYYVHGGDYYMKVNVDNNKLFKKAGEFAYTRPFGNIHERNHVIPKPHKLRKINKSKKLKKITGSFYVKEIIS